VELGVEAVEPPETLFHGTTTRFLTSIREKGLVPGSRHQVHLSADETPANAVGQRHGKPVVLHVGCGHRFFRADNGVWLTDAVPPEFLDKLR
jgi:putative RNA 2'-phosphotransferase